MAACSLIPAISALLSKVSVTLATEGVALVHNLMLGKFALVGKGTDSIVELCQSDSPDFLLPFSRVWLR